MTYLNETSKLSSPPTSPDTASAISSQASEVSRWGCDGPDGTEKSGPADSRARTLAPPTRPAQDLTESDLVCGGIGCGLFGHLDPVGCSLRTHLLSDVAERTKCSARWKSSVTPAGRWWWVLTLSEQDTGATDAGSLPTLCRSDATRGAGSLASRKRRGAGGPTLIEALLPTLTCADAKNNGSASQLKRDTVSLNASAGGPLSPRWCEQHMGYPDGWTELED